MSQTRINRLELIRLKRRKGLATQGVDILTGKKEALLNEFRSVVRSLRGARERLEERMTGAARAMVMARAQEPDHFLATASMAARRRISFNISMKKVWGVLSPRIDFPGARRDPFQRGSAPGHRSLAVDGAAGMFEDALDSLVETGAAEFTALEMGGAIKRTTRRINAINLRLLPQIASDARRISDRLEEMERDGQFRMKRYKSLKQRGAGE